MLINFANLFVFNFHEICDKWRRSLVLIGLPNDVYNTREVWPHLMILDKIPYMQIVLHDTQTWFILFYEKSAAAIYKYVRCGNYL